MTAHARFTCRRRRNALIWTSRQLLALASRADIPGWKKCSLHWKYQLPDASSRARRLLVSRSVDDHQFTSSGWHEEVWAIRGEKFWVGLRSIWLAADFSKGRQSCVVPLFTQLRWTQESVLGALILDYNTWADKDNVDSVVC